MARSRQYRHQYLNNSGGLNTKSSPLYMPVEDTPEILNVDLDQTGAIKKRYGWTRYSIGAIGAGGSVQGIFRLVKKDGTAYVLAGEGGSFYEEFGIGNFTTSRASGLNATRYWLGQTYNNNLYLANGYDPIQIYPGGADVTPLADEDGANLRPEWVGTNQPTGITLTHHNRGEHLTAWGTGDDPSRVWFSDLQNPLEWVDGNAFNILVLNDNGEPVTAVSPLYDLTVVFKETQAAVYSGDSVDTIFLQQVFPVGCPAPRSIVHIGRDVYFWSQKGPARASGIEQYGDISPLSMATKIEQSLNAVNWALADQIVGVHDKDSSKVIWFYPRSGGSGNNDSALVYHYDIEAWTYYDNIEPHSVLSYESYGGDIRHLFGDYEGHINELGVGHSDNGAAYTSRYVTPWYDFGDYARRDRVIDLRMATDVIPSHNSYGALYDIGLYDDALYDDPPSADSSNARADIYYQWDFEHIWHYLAELGDILGAKAHPLGSGNVFRLKIENTDADTDFKLLGWSMVTGPRGRR